MQSRLEALKLIQSVCPYKTITDTSDFAEPVLNYIEKQIACIQYNKKRDGIEIVIIESNWKEEYQDAFVKICIEFFIVLNI